MANGQIVPQGQYCSLYTEAWPIKYATNGGQWRGQDQYTVDYSFGYAKTDAGVDPLVGDPKGAAYQAVADIKWSSLQPFCSTLLGYGPTLVSTTTTATVTSTSYVPLGRRTAAQTTPAGLSKYQAAVLTSACNIAVTSPTTTVTIVSTTTRSAVSSVSIQAYSCDPAKAAINQYNQGGCVSNTNSCWCNAGADGNAYCSDDSGSNADCAQDSDCPTGQFCNISNFVNGRTPGYCAKGDSCSSTFGGSSKRELFGLAAGPRVEKDTPIIGPNTLAALSAVQANALPTDLPATLASALTSIASVAAAAIATDSA